MTNSDAEALLHQTADATRPDIEHFAYFPTAELRADFIYRCLKTGFRLRNTSEPPEPGAGFGAIIFHKAPANDQDQEKLSALLKTFATEYRGRYEGWETQDSRSM